jgi:hypothetical protein
MDFKMTREYLLSEGKCLKLDLPIPHQAILEEAKAIRDMFIPYRTGEYDHNGWHSVSLHGFSHDKPASYDAYGFTDGGEAAKQFIWTKAADRCPITVEWLKTMFPTKKFARVRFMLLEAGGYIAPHTDAPIPHIEPVNIALSNPDGCDWVWGDGDILKFQPGDICAMNIGLEHSVKNNSNEDRYHMIVHHHDSTDEWKKLLINAMEKHEVQGSFVSSSFLY